MSTGTAIASRTSVSARVMPRMFPCRKMSCASPVFALEMRRMPAAAATAYVTPITASGGTPARPPPPTPKKTAPAHNDTMAVHLIHFDGNTIHRRQRLLVHDVVDVANAKRALEGEGDAVDIVRDFVERVTHHEHSATLALMQIAH